MEGCVIAMIQLANLRLPFDIGIECRVGDCRLHWAKQSVVLAAGKRRRVAAYGRFGIWLPRFELQLGSTAARLVQPSVRLLHADALRGGVSAVDDFLRPLTLSIAMAVFSEPDAPWSRSYVAATLGLSKDSLSARLLIEGSALTYIIREQRLMRTLFDVARGKSLHARNGFASLERRNTAFFDCFGVCVEELAMISQTGQFELSDDLCQAIPVTRCHLEAGNASRYSTSA